MQDHEASSHPTIVTGLHDGPVSVAAIEDHHGCGGEAIFVGRTRTDVHAEHGSLVALEYEAYEAMASTMLESMARDAAQAHGCHAVRLVHALGRVELGQASVVVQVLCPHRAEAFVACRALIDRLKAELPVWKHEVWERGRTFSPGVTVEPPSQEASQ